MANYIVARKIRNLNSQKYEEEYEQDLYSTKSKCWRRILDVVVNSLHMAVIEKIKVTAQMETENTKVILYYPDQNKTSTYFIKTINEKVD